MSDKLTPFEMKEYVIEKTILCINTAEEYFKKHIPIPRITFTLKGKVAGKFLYRPKKHLYELQYNFDIMFNDLSTFLSDTVPHEVSHMLNTYLYKGRKHNDEWAAIMKQVYDTNPNIRHNMPANMGKRGEIRIKYYCPNCLQTFKRSENTKVLKCPGCGYNKVERAPNTLKYTDLVNDGDLIEDNNNISFKDFAND
jgi:SprT protein